MVGGMKGRALHREAGWRLRFHLPFLLLCFLLSSSPLLLLFPSLSLSLSSLTSLPCLQSPLLPLIPYPLFPLLLSLLPFLPGSLFPLLSPLPSPSSPPPFPLISRDHPPRTQCWPGIFARIITHFRQVSSRNFFPTLFFFIPEACASVGLRFLSLNGMFTHDVYWCLQWPSEGGIWPALSLLEPA